mgnify:CR=1 FL=1
MRVTETLIEALILLVCGAGFAAIAFGLTGQPPVQVGPFTFAGWCAGFAAIALLAAILILVSED